MRTQATRHSDCTAHLHRSKRPPFLDTHGDRAREASPLTAVATGATAAVRARIPSSSASGCGPLDDQPHRAAELGGRARAIAEDHQGTVRLACEARESHGVRPGQQGRSIEHDEREGAAAQQHVGAPGRARRIVRPDHPHPLGVAEMHPVARVERALCVDVGHPVMLRGSRLDDGAGERRLATAIRSHDLGEPAARQPAPLEHGIERRDPGGDRGRDGRRRG
jgi:hypothetical protein